MYSGAAPINNNLSLYINGFSVPTAFVGLSSAGIYQINLTLPPDFLLGTSDVPISAIIGGLQTQPDIVISLQAGPLLPPGGGTAGVTGGGGFTGGGGGLGFLGSSGLSGGGSGGGSGSGSQKAKRKPYHPRLSFPPK